MTVLQVFRAVMEVKKSQSRLVLVTLIVSVLNLILTVIILGSLYGGHLLSPGEPSPRIDARRPDSSKVEPRVDKPRKDSKNSLPVSKPTASDVEISPDRAGKVSRRHREGHNVKRQTITLSELNEFESLPKKEWTDDMWAKADELKIRLKERKSFCNSSQEAHQECFDELVEFYEDKLEDEGRDPEWAPERESEVLAFVNDINELNGGNMVTNVSVDCGQSFCHLKVEFDSVDEGPGELIPRLMQGPLKEPAASVRSFEKEFHVFFGREDGRIPDSGVLVLDPE